MELSESDSSPYNTYKRVIESISKYSKLCLEQPFVWPATLSFTATCSGTGYFSYIMPLVWPATLSYLVTSQAQKDRKIFGTASYTWIALKMCIFAYNFCTNNYLKCIVYTSMDFSQIHCLRFIFSNCFIGNKILKAIQRKYWKSIFRTKAWRLLQWVLNFFEQPPLIPSQFVCATEVAVQKRVYCIAEKK